MLSHQRYRLEHLIGQGSFGRVFRGRDLLTNSVVAMKLIPKVGKSEKDLALLRQEFNIQKELDHPNIVRVVDAYENEGELIVVTEFVPGELHKLFDLYKGNDKQRRLPESRVREIAIDVLSALFYLHQHRIIHRDVKPQNILIDGEGRAKLCDFGFARNLGLQTYVLTSIKGTPLYMAPELIEEKPYDHAADIWSVGCILYELCTGAPPFSTKNLFQLIKKVRYELVQYPADMSDVCRSFLQGLLEKDSRKRLIWPELLRHPFVSDHFDSVQSTFAPPSSLPPPLHPLTEPMTESQELAKEIQRRDKAKLLPGGSQTLIKVAQRYEEQKGRIREMQQRMLQEQESLSHVAAAAAAAATAVVQPHHLMFHNRARRSSDTNLMPFYSDYGARNSNTNRRHSDLIQYMQQQAQYLTPQPPIRTTASQLAAQYNYAPPPPPPVRTAASSGIALFSPIHPAARTETTPITVNSKVNSNKDRHSPLEMETDPMENEEWLGFLDCQLEEVGRDIEVLNNHNFISMIIKPMRNVNTVPEVVEKIVSVLVVPFVTEDISDAVLRSLLEGYRTVRVLGHLVASCGVLVEGSEVLGLTTTLVTRLVHTRRCFAEQLVQESSSVVIVRRLLGFRQTRWDCVSWLVQAMMLGVAGAVGMIEGCLGEEAKVVLECAEDERCLQGLGLLLCIWGRTVKGEGDSSGKRWRRICEDEGVRRRFRSAEAKDFLSDNVRGEVMNIMS